MGRARMAYRSPSAFAAAMGPKSAGSSTSGVKKSRLATMASPSSSRYTAASSGPSSPTRSRSSGTCGTCCRMRPRSSGPSLHAQPAPWEYWVRRAASAEGEFMATEAMATRGVSQGFLPVPLHDGILETVAAHHAVANRRFRVPACSRSAAACSGDSISISPEPRPRQRRRRPPVETVPARPAAHRPRSPPPPRASARRVRGSSARPHRPRGGGGPRGRLRAPPGGRSDAPRGRSGRNGRRGPC